MRRPFARVLVANRGEIALRIIRACHELGVEAVAVYSDADLDAPHVRAADRAVRIGPAPAAESYLRIDALLDVARETRCEALHPGYGFLSERAALAEACEAAGIAFVGPTSTTLSGLGDKLSARRAASAAGVPVVPGALDTAAVDEPARAVEQAEGIGWPLLVKASAGGGGRGMRRVDRAEDLPSALASASREAAAAFGDGAVYLERFVAGARHVEVQLLGDAQGAIVALGERDCSIQRRHQKLLEEAPAPGLTPERRRALHALAVAVARTFRLRNAATAEFLLDPDGRFWFLEVNTRLQVEHGVTELVTGVDLVQEQLWIAAGRPLGGAILRAADRAADPQAHAVEVRISAEDPAREFVPTPGTIVRWRMPAGPGVRVDAGVEEGTTVAAEYDPLLAKLLVVGPDRDATLARLVRALDEFEVVGVQTTLPFHRWIARDAAFAAGRISTAFVPERWRPGDLRRAAADRAAALAAAYVGAGRDAVAGTVGATGSAGGPGAAPATIAGGAGGAPAPIAGGPSVSLRPGFGDPAAARPWTASLPVAAIGSPWSAAGRREATDRWPR